MSASSLVFVHGGEAHRSYEAYLEWLRTYWETFPYVGDKQRWKRRIFDRHWESLPVYAPEMPGKTNAQYAEWRVVFDKVAAAAGDTGIYVGHSLGGNFLAKWFAENAKPARAIHLVAPCFGGIGGGFDLPDDLSAVSRNAGKVHLWYSSDDPVVDPADFARYRYSLSEAVPHGFSDRGHFNQAEFPELEERIAEEIGR